ncbi:bile acid-CoA:amino acid N-acyltransferase-like [Seriola lalandi dorsalis]|uniref:bile acid-CoA:amino acid N-acyltransferase-like n=2 Tax=Seriola TaxID=8160 RepID=UPI000C6FA995|nr:bile acid-CoA:amino acid N-acyltransferase-like [Seriola lalandi dorsalis]XP_023279355.1 bile acid-CoA:amino acid N-acyltransferase-like [Seriola lalandi dorsalis]XP_023279356.1 bile acid-CoA:amino acid N-acyltransferase-like [Seriola lalandi dorsalis]
MLQAHMSVTTIQQLTEIMIIPCFSLHRKLASLHRAVGAVRWRSSYRPAPLLTAAPARALIDEQISIKGRFLPPHCPVTVCARMHSEDDDLWEAFAHYNTNADGTVNLTKDHSVGGSYLGCEPMGLFWGLQPAPGAREGLRLRKKNVEIPYVVHMSLLEGHVSPGEGQSTELAAVTTERWYTAPGVKRIKIRQNGIVGTLFLPPGPGPFPAMLDLWGMGGALVEYRSALFASRGYASLSIAYIGHKELPGPQNRINVGASYFNSAFDLLRDHRQVCADRVGIIGLSFGVYLALRIATETGAKPSCLICINGPIGSAIRLSDADGRTENFEGQQKYWTYNDQGHVSFRDISLPANLPPESKVKLENLACPLMYIVGEDDLSASSIENANLIEETLRAADKSQLFTRLSYPGAGHLIEPPYSPNSRISLWSVKPKKLITLWGGHLAPHAAAQEDAWKKILDFMENNLRR